MTYKNILKSVVLGAGLVVFAAACNNQVAYTPPSNSQTPPPQTPPAQSTTQTYSNSSYNFSFTYGNDFSFVTPTYGNLKNQLTQVQMGNANYPKTNFGDADVTVSQDYAANQAACLALTVNSGGSKAGFANPQVINGATFYSEKTGDAAAGNLYNSTVYRTYHGTDCIEVAQTIHTSNIQNYPSDSGVTEVNQTPIQAELDQILQSFTFTK